MKLLVSNLLLTLVVFVNLKCANSSRARDEHTIAGHSGTSASIISQPGPSTSNIHEPFIEVRNQSYIFVEMFNGKVYGGRLRLRENNAFPGWMRLRHTGHYVYVRMPNGVGLATELIHLSDHESEPGKIEASIKINGVIHGASLYPIGNTLPSNSRTRVYVGLENGIILSGILEPLW